MHRREGSVTVFLSLIGILIFALFGTLLETARYTVCENHATRTLRTSAEGLMTEYSRPLYDHYGVFFIESGGTPFEQVIGRYANDTMTAAKKGNLDFFEGSLAGINVTDCVYLGENGAEPLQKEINQYMGRVLTKEQLNKFISDTGKLADVEDDAKEIEETVHEEEEAAKLDVELLELMKLVDGISVSDGTVCCQEEFIKMFGTREKKGQNFGVTEGVVWEKMQPHIDDSVRTWKMDSPSGFLARVSRVKALTDKAIRQGDELKEQYKKIKASNGDEHDRMFDRLIAALPVLRRNKEILTETETLLVGKEMDDCKEELTKLWKDYDTTSIAFDYTGVTESGGADNPKDSFGEAWDKGILNLVCASPSKLSKKSISMPDSYATYYKVQKDSEAYDKRVSDFAKEDEVSLQGILGDMGTYSFDEFCLDQYIERHFGSYVQTVDDWKQSLDYGWEYIVAGKKSDQDNLKAVLNRILLIRTVVNFLALQRDSVRKKEAYAAAVAIVGFTGLAPLITLTQTLILLTWSLSESLVDVAALLQKRHVPVIKKPSDLVTNFTQIVQLSHDAIAKRAAKFNKEKKSSFGYKEYLLLFLALTSQSTRRYRIMDLIECSMKKNGYGGFQLGSCVYEMTVQGEFVFPSRFFRMAPIETMLGRDIRNCRVKTEVQVGYY